MKNIATKYVLTALYTNMSIEHQEYIVTLHRAEDLDAIYAELENLGCGLHDHFPDRAIDCVHRRPISRNTHYLMTAEEAALIERDPRVAAVSLAPHLRNDVVKRVGWSETSSNFGRNGTTSAAERNWGLPRVWTGSNPTNFGVDGVSTWAGTVTVYSSGTNVDVVMIDGLSNRLHPEYAKNPDGTGGSRRINYDWFANLNSTVYPSNPNSTYSYHTTGSSGHTADNNHGAHTAGTVAGNTQGWARNANIYNIDPIDRDGINFPNYDSSYYVFDFVRAFHNTKAVNTSTGVKNPTITNNSWGYSYNQFAASSITAVNYRGTVHTTSTSFSSAELISWGFVLSGPNVYYAPYREPSIDADVEDAIADGVIIVGSAGNNYWKVDVPGGPDYDNYATVGGNNYYLWRGTTPGTSPGVISVGSIDIYKDDRKSQFSNCGPRVDIYAPGSYIMSSFNNGLSFGSVSDPRNSSYNMGKISGTSMSGPQVAGVIACVLERNLTWTQTNVINYLPNMYATGQITSTSGGANDFRDLQGAPNRFLKVPTELLTPPGPIVQPLTATTVLSLIDLDALTAIPSPIVPVTAADGTPPYTFAVSPALPTGLSYNTSGQITGTPTVLHNTSSFTVTVTDSASDTANALFNLSVYDTPPVASTLVPTIVATPYVNIPAFSIVSATGGTPPYVWALDASLPAGLNFNVTTGELSGMSTVTAAVRTYIATVRDAFNHTSSTTFTLESKATTMVLTVVTTQVTAYAYESVNTTPVTLSGGNGTKAWSISPSLPAGLSFNTATGQITGSATALRTNTSYVVSVVDQVGQVRSATFALVVNSRPLTFTKLYKKIVIKSRETVNAFPLIEAAGGSGQLTYSISPAAPAGMTFNTATGELSGTPNVTAYSHVYIVTVNDQVGQSVSDTMIIKIRVPTHVIVADDQDLIYETLFDLMGTTATGYGAFLASEPVVEGDRVRADDWNEIVQDVRRAIIHQSGNPNIIVHTTGTSSNVLLSATTGTIVDDAVPDRLYTALQFLTATSGTVYTGTQYLPQVSYMTVNTYETSPEEWVSEWTYDPRNWHTVASNGHMSSVSYSWFHRNHLNYFFNLGGKITPAIRIDKGSTKDKQGWLDIIPDAEAVTFGKDEFYEALANGGTYSRMVIGTGNVGLSSTARTSYWKKKIIKVKKKYKNDYSTNAIEIKYTIVPNSSEIIASVTLLAGYHDYKKKGKYGKKSLLDKKKYFGKKFLGKKFLGKKLLGKKLIYGKNFHSTNVLVKVKVTTDFLTRYSIGNNGGIAAPVPQSQLVGHHLSGTPYPEVVLKPIPIFSFGRGQTSDVQKVTLRNNSTLTCNVNEISLVGPLGGYSTGIVTPTSLTIDPFDSGTFDLQYSGDTPGYYRGYVYVKSNVNDLTLFTEVSVGSVNPPSLIMTTTTNALIVQDFEVDHAGGDYRQFTVTINTATGFTLTPHVPGVYDSFRVTFNPHGLPNGLHATTATVTIRPLDSSVEDIVVHVPIRITSNIRNETIGNWRSAATYDNGVIGVSYDYIGGLKYLTIGVCADPVTTIGGSPPIEQLGTEDGYFNWAEVYRIPIEAEHKTYFTKDYAVKTVDFNDGNSIGYFFGAGDAEQSICTVKGDRYGNILVNLNTVRESTDITSKAKTLDGLSKSFFYYDETSNRITQLEQPEDLVESHLTHYFMGFNKNGSTDTTLIDPNPN